MSSFGNIFFFCSQGVIFSYRLSMQLGGIKMSPPNIRIIVNEPRHPLMFHSERLLPLTRKDTLNYCNKLSSHRESKVI